MLKSLFIVLISLFLNVAVLAQPRPLPDEPGEIPGAEVTYTLGLGATERFSQTHFDFYPRQDLSRAIGLRLVGLSSTVDIKAVIIVYADYNEQRSEVTLEGDIKAGTSKGTFLGGRPIHHIEIRAATPFWRKPGQYRVDLTSLR